jgi:hypothetical protein
MRANPLQSSLMEFWRRLNVLNGLRCFLETRLRESKKSIAKRNKAFRAKGWRKRLGSWDAWFLDEFASLILTDLDGPTDHGCLYHYPTGVMYLKGGEQIRAVDSMLWRNNAWILAQAYEAHDSFLKDILGKFLYCNRSAADRKGVKKFASSARAKALSASNISFWRAFVEYECRGTKRSLLDLARSFAPTFREVEVRNNLGLDLGKWWKAATEARHAIVHSEFGLSEKQLQSLDGYEQNMLKRYFGMAGKPGNLRLMPTDSQTHAVLQVFAGHGFSVFKHLSRVRAYDADILGTHFKKRRARL